MSDASKALVEAAQELDAAAVKEGIDPEGPLGLWVRAQRQCFLAQAAIFDQQLERMTDLLILAHHIIELDAKALQAKETFSAQQAEQSARILTTLQVQVAGIEQKVLDSWTKEAWTSVKQALVVRARVFERVSRLRDASFAIGLAAAFGSAGYLWRTHDDRHAVELYSLCSQQMQRDQNGQSWCWLNRQP